MASKEMELLKQERANPSFPVREMTYLIDGGQQKAERREWVRSLAEKDPAFDNKDQYFRSRSEGYEKALEIVHKLQIYKRKYNLTEEDFEILKFEVVTQSLPTMLHDVAFVPFLKSQCSPEQIEKWVIPAEKYAIIGSYSQTELGTCDGHGSNVMALETTATFVEETDEFEVHTPTLTATKWWPGCMAKTATHTIVMARLIIKGKDYGIHGFIVPLRSLKDHMPLPGRTIGDIGPKVGANSIDNGFLRLDRVRIPRENMLMGFAKVDRQGTYSKPPHDKLAYMGMIYIRASMVRGGALVLSRGVTIATRYSAVRCQFSPPDDPSKPERAVLDYRSQQYRIFPYLAATYAFLFTGRQMQNLYLRMTTGKGKGEGPDLSILPEVHATSAGLKAYMTSLGAEGLESCRKACGGHGYTLSGGIGDLVAVYSGLQTAEGENYLLTQQVARYLLKSLRSAQSGEKPVGGSAYLGDPKLLEDKCPVAEEKDFLNPDFQLHALTHCAARLVNDTAALLAERVGAGRSLGDSWNDALIEIYRISRAHSIYSVANSFITTLYSDIKQSHPALFPVLKKLSDLYGNLPLLQVLWSIDTDLGNFTEDGYMSGQQCKMLRSAIRQLLLDIRPDAVSLVDAFNYSDHTLNSAIGRYDGDVYRALYEFVQREPLNRSPIGPGYERYIRPLISGEIDTTAKL